MGQNSPNQEPSTNGPEPDGQPPKRGIRLAELAPAIYEIRDTLREALNDTTESETLHTPIADAPPPAPEPETEPTPEPDPAEPSGQPDSSETNSGTDRLSVTTGPEPEYPITTPNRKPGIWAGRRRR